MSSLKRSVNSKYEYGVFMMNKDMGKNSGKVSVIIPVYNCEKTIDECIQSIKNQTYENWEIVIIDDGSTDNTYKKVDAWAQSDIRIKVFQQENQGSGPARNRGLEEAVGEYIAFLDGDDFWQNKYALKEIMSSIEGRVYDVIGTFYCSYRDGKFIELPRHRQYFAPGEKLGKWIDFREEQDCYGYCSYLYRRSFLIENNIVFPSYRRFQDPPFLAKVLEKVKKYYVLPIEWSSYRHRYGGDVLSTEQKINDYLRGALDVAEIAYYQRMGNLIKNVMDRVNSYCGVIIKSILMGNIGALQLIVELQRYIDDKTIENYPLQFIDNALKAECQKITRMFIMKINKVSKLIIYGTGTYGQRFFKRIQKQNIQTEIIFAETSEPRNRIICGRACYSLDELKMYREDSLIIIAVKSEEMQNEMISNLKAMGFKKYQLCAENLSIALECTEADSLKEI